MQPVFLSLFKYPEEGRLGAGQRGPWGSSQAPSLSHQNVLFPYFQSTPRLLPNLPSHFSVTAFLYLSWFPHFGPYFPWWYVSGACAQPEAAYLVLPPSPGTLCPLEMGEAQWSSVDLRGSARGFGSAVYSHRLSPGGTILA